MNQRNLGIRRAPSTISLRQTTEDNNMYKGMHIIYRSVSGES